MEFSLLKEANNSIATKMCANLLNNLKKLVYDTIQRLNCVVHYLNMKIE